MSILNSSQKRSLNLAGVLAFVAAVQWILGVIVAEATYPNYSISQNFLSDLGATCPNGAGTSPCFIVQPSSLIFNTILSLLGLLTLASAYLIHRTVGKRLFPTFFGLWGLGALICGIFPETIILVHELGALVAFMSGGIALLVAYRLGLDMSKTFRYASIILGVLALAALIPVIFSIIIPPFIRWNNDFGIGPGGMERVVAYPITLWELAFGTYLMNTQVP